MKQLAALLFLSLGLWPVAQAGMSFDEILFDTELEERTLSPQERAEVDAKHEKEREAAAERRRQHEQVERERQAIEAQRQASRPKGVRLTEQHCMSCHNPEVLAARRYSHPGWYLTVARMRYWHQVALSSEEAALITRHLAETQAAPPSKQLLEYLLILLLPALLIAGLIYHRTRLRKGVSR